MQTSRPLHSLLIFAMTLGMTCNLCADVIMFDFGSTTVTGSARTNSPYHTANGDFTDLTWNWQDRAKNTYTNFKWSDNTDAVGVSTRVFKGGTAASSVAWDGWSTSYSGTAVNTGIYASTSVGADGSMMNTPFTNERSIGFQASGLAAGQYEVYIVGRNTDYITEEYTLNYYVGAGASQAGFDFASYDSASVTFAANATDKTSDWVFDANESSASNYVKLSVTVTAENPYLNIGSLGNGVNGAFNAIQIVAIPEPSSLALMAGAIGFLILITRKHRKR